MVAKGTSFARGVISAGNTTIIPINFQFNENVSGLVVYVGGGVLTDADWVYNSNPSQIVIQNGQNNSKFKAGLSVHVQRETDIEQDIDYVDNRDIPDKSFVDSLDKLALIMQEQKDTGGRGLLPELINLWYGWTDVVEVDQLAGYNYGGAALRAFNNPVDRQEKIRTGVLGYPILIKFRAPGADGFYYPWIALPNSWSNVFFFEAFRHSVVWTDSGRTANLNNVVWRIWVKKVPSVENHELSVEVRRYE